MPNKDFFLTSGKEARARCLFSTSSLAADERIKRTRIGQGQRQVHKTHLQQSPIFNWHEHLHSPWNWNLARRKMGSRETTILSFWGV